MYKFYGQKAKLFSPAIASTKNGIVTVMCRAAATHDWGYIELVSSISEDGGESWTNLKSIAVPPARFVSDDINNTKTAFFLQPCLTVAENGDLILITTFLPESKGKGDMKFLEKKKIAYASFDGGKCPVIYDKDENFYLILENGSIIDRHKKVTPYVHKSLGELYKGEEYVGNIYLNGAKGKSKMAVTTFGAPLKAPKRSYIYAMRSTDGGKTWSAPADITANIFNEKDGAYVTTASANGVVTVTGRIIVPLTSPAGTISIYSDDNGATWHRNRKFPYAEGKGFWSVARAGNHQLYAFCDVGGKTPTVISNDNGITWYKGDKVGFKASTAKKSAINVGEKIYVSHSAKKDGTGAVSVGIIDTDRRGKVKSVSWKKEDIRVNSEQFKESCLAQLDSKTLGIIYESDANIIFDKIRLVED